VKTPLREHATGSIYILVAAILWGTTGTAATFAPDVGAVAIGAAAMGIGGLLQAGLAGRDVAKALPQLRAQWKLVLVGGLAVAVYPLAFYASMRLAGVTIGTVISIGAAPLFAALIEFLLDKSRLSKRWLFGAALGLTGMVLLAFAEGSGGESAQESGNATLGVFLGVVAALTYALYSWTARRIMRRGLLSKVAMGAVFGVGGLLLMPVLFITGAPLLASWTNAAVGIYMALVPMFLGYICFGFGLARVQASTATTITLLEPAVAAALAVLIVGERLPLSGWVGVALIIACLVWVTMPPIRGRLKPQPLSAS
jgi:drug/metabolite transporter, DME family